MVAAIAALALSLLLLGPTPHAAAVPGSAISVAAANVVCHAAVALGVVDEYVAMKLRDVLRIAANLEVARRALSDSVKWSGAVGKACLRNARLIGHGNALERQFKAQIGELRALGAEASVRALLASGRLREFILVFGQWNRGSSRCVAYGAERPQNKEELRLNSYLRNISGAVKGPKSEEERVTGDFPESLNRVLLYLLSLDEDVSMKKDDGCPLTRWTRRNATVVPADVDGVRWAGGLFLVRQSGPRWMVQMSDVPMIRDVKESFGAFVRIARNVTGSFSNFVALLLESFPELLNNPSVDALLSNTGLRTFMAPASNFWISDDEMEVLARRHCGVSAVLRGGENSSGEGHAEPGGQSQAAEGGGGGGDGLSSSRDSVAGPNGTVTKRPGLEVETDFNAEVGFEPAYVLAVVVLLLAVFTVAVLRA